MNSSADHPPDKKKICCVPSFAVQSPRGVLGLCHKCTTPLSQPLKLGPPRSSCKNSGLFGLSRTRENSVRTFHRRGGLTKFKYCNEIGCAAQAPRAERLQRTVPYYLRTCLVVERTSQNGSLAAPRAGNVFEVKNHYMEVLLTVCNVKIGN